MESSTEGAGRATQEGMIVFWVSRLDLSVGPHLTPAHPSGPYQLKRSSEPYQQPPRPYKVITKKY
jgi:hypothetical protein